MKVDISSSMVIKTLMTDDNGIDVYRQDSLDGLDDEGESSIQSDDDDDEGKYTCAKYICHFTNSTINKGKSLQRSPVLYLFLNLTNIGYGHNQMVVALPHYRN